jgi:hypothetical protein
MDFLEKAALRMKHWLDHNSHHEQEYESFALQLEQASQATSAQLIREMAALTRKSSACLEKALEALAEPSNAED